MTCCSVISLIWRLTCQGDSELRYVWNKSKKRIAPQACLRSENTRRSSKCKSRRMIQSKVEVLFIDLPRRGAKLRSTRCETVWIESSSRVRLGSRLVLAQVTHVSLNISDVGRGQVKDFKVNCESLHTNLSCPVISHSYSSYFPAQLIF